MLDEQAAHVVGRTTRRELVKYVVGEGRVAGQFPQNVGDVGLADPRQTTVGPGHRGECVDDDLQLGRDRAGVGVGEQP